MKLKTALIAVSLSILFSMSTYAGWMQDNGQWKYDKDGTTLTNQWIKDQEEWYYLGVDGVMLADTTQMIDGTDYTFDASGKWLDPLTSSIGANTTLYTNEEFEYTFEIPDYLSPSKAFKTSSINLSVENEFMSFTFVNHSIPANTTPSEYSDYYALMNQSLFRDLNFINKSDVELGGYTYQLYHYQNTAKTICNDIYFRAHGSKLVIIKVNYTTEKQNEALNVLSTLKKTS